MNSIKSNLTTKIDKIKATMENYMMWGARRNVWDRVRWSVGNKTENKTKHKIKKS